MTNRITNELLNKLARVISEELGVPVRVVSEGSARYSFVREGENTRLTPCLPKRELYNQMHAFLSGVQEARRVYQAAREGKIV